MIAVTLQAHLCELQIVLFHVLAKPSNSFHPFITAQELGVIRENADKKRQGKLKDARNAFLAEVREKAEQLDLSFEDIVEMENQSRSRSKRQRGERSPVQVKYRSPDGEEWSGRGRAPVWLRDLEAAGHNRDEYLVQAEK